MAEDSEKTKTFSKRRSLIFPCATVFISSFCIMVLELVAGRLIARFLGASLYTWTSVIGVVLAGITIGNYLGGRIADRFIARKALAVLFTLASATCVSTVVLNNRVALWLWLWQFNWPLRVFSHVSIVFLLPSILLGTISPVVAKMALDKGLAAGRTVGDIYAWGAAGSIVGTFAAGYYLIAMMGSITIIWSISGVLLIMGIFYWSRFKTAYLVVVLVAAAFVTSIGPWSWAQNCGAAIGLREKSDSAILYETESQYSYIQVRRISKVPEKRHFIQDKLVHSSVNLDDVIDLQYNYEQVYAAVTHRFGRGKDKLSFLTLGGGGYVFPSYIEKTWPGSRNDVVEIDPAVTEAALNIFWPRKDTSIRTITMDARNYVDELLMDSDAVKITYDFVYEDALNNYSVPYQLTTLEFNERISQIMSDDGIYMVELIDNFDTGLFVGAFINTLEETFEYVYAISNQDVVSASERKTFVVIASHHSLDLEDIGAEYKGIPADVLSEEEMRELRKKSKGIVLTDDYAPVENLMAPTVRKEAAEALARRKELLAIRDNREQAVKIVAEIESLLRKSKTDQAIDRLKKVDSKLSAHCVRMLASNLAKQVETTDGKYKVNPALADIYYYLAMVLSQLGQKSEAQAQLRFAEQAYREKLTNEPDSHDMHSHLAGIMFLLDGDPAQIVYHFQRAAELKPDSLQNQVNFIMALETQGQLDAAIAAAQKAITIMQNNGRDNDATQLRQYLQKLKNKKARLMKK